MKLTKLHGYTVILTKNWEFYPIQFIMNMGDYILQAVFALLWIAVLGGGLYSIIYNIIT